MKKKSKSNTPRAKRLNQQRRLQVGAKWLTGYRGKHLVKGYARHFGVDLLTAIRELRLLGKDVSETYENAVKTTLSSIQRKKAEKKEMKQLEEKSCLVSEQDHYFYFIAGYTSGGAAYGITWEQAKESLERID